MIVKIENKRIYLRELNDQDIPALAAILKDPETMYAYEASFTDKQVTAWLKWNQESYEQNGFGLWAIIDKQTNQFVGQCGIVYSEVENEELLEVGYLVNKHYWGKGYASEASQLCITYAKETLGAEKICSIIRDTNIASQNVAKKNQMVVIKEFAKDYSGTPIKHFVYSRNLS